MKIFPPPALPPPEDRLTDCDEEYDEEYDEEAAPPRVACGLFYAVVFQCAVIVGLLVAWRAFR